MSLLTVKVNFLV